MFITTYHPQRNGQVEQFNRTMLNARRAYVADHLTEYGLCTGAIMDAYNSQVYCCRSRASFELVLSLILPPVANKAQLKVSLYPSSGVCRDSSKERLKNLVAVPRNALEKAKGPKNRKLTLGVVLLHPRYWEAIVSFCGRNAMIRKNGSPTNCHR